MQLLWLHQVRTSTCVLRKKILKSGKIQSNARSKRYFCHLLEMLTKLEGDCYLWKLKDYYAVDLRVLKSNEITIDYLLFIIIFVFVRIFSHRYTLQLSLTTYSSYAFDLAMQRMNWNLMLTLGFCSCWFTSSISQ